MSPRLDGWAASGRWLRLHYVRDSAAICGLQEPVRNIRLVRSIKGCELCKGCQLALRETPTTEVGPVPS